MHRSRFAAVTLAVSLAFARPAAAQQPPEPVRLPEILVSATRIESTLATSPDAITVVTREEIESIAARTVADVLATVPGVAVSRSGQPGAQTSVFLRGASSGQTLVLVDGVRVNNAFGGRFDFANLTVDNVERIEVVRGPQSTRYGSDALGGVINVVTRRGAAANAAAAQVELGGNASALTRLTLAAAGEQVSFTAEGSIFDTDNERPNSQYHAAGGSFGASWKPGARFDLGLSGSYRESQAGTPDDVSTSDPNDLTRTETSLVTLFAHAAPAAWWDLRLSLAGGHERMRFSGPEPNPPYFSGDEEAETVADSQRVDLQNVFAVAPGHRLFVGLSYDHAPTEYSSASPFGATTLEETMDDAALAGQYDWSPSQAFTATLGGRVDDFDSFGTHATWRAGGRYTVAASGTIVRANAGTGFRAPTIADLYFPGSANPDLEPEESMGWDVGVEQPLAGGRLQLGATWFRSDFDNLIQWAPSASGQWGGRMENVAEARTEGLEAFLQWLPTEALAVTGSYTWLATAEDRTSGEPLLRRPEHSGSLAAHYRFPRWARLDTLLTFSGPAPDKDFSGFPAADVENDGWLRWDLGLTVTPAPWLDLTARVENLLDEEYEQAYGFPALGRVFWAGGTARF